MVIKSSVVFAGISLAVAASAWTAAAHAKDLYRWVDEKGQTHVADTVPPQYKRSATRIDTRASEISESDRAKAVERAAREKAAAERGQVPSSTAPRIVKPVPPNRPAASISEDKQTQCEQMRRAYAESQACFAPYHTVHGAVKAEAYQHCTEVPEPSQYCGLPSNSHVDD